MYDAVFFDVGNTLLYPYPSVAVVCHEVFQKAGYEHDLSEIEGLMSVVDDYYEDRYSEDDTFWTDECATSEVWIGMYSLLCRRLGIESDAELLAQRIYDEFGDSNRWKAYGDVSHAFQRLKDVHGARIGVISNWDTRLERLLEGLGLAEMLDTIVSSATVGLHKPDARIFELACERLDVSPGRSVHVGDHLYADYEGASSAGMTPVLIDRHGTSATQGVLSTLDDLEISLGWEV